MGGDRGGRAWRGRPQACPSGLRVLSGGLSRRSEPSDHLQAAGSLSIHCELRAHSPTGAQSTQAKASQAHARARPQAMQERAWGWAMAVGTEQPPSARPSERCERRLQLHSLLQAPRCSADLICLLLLLHLIENTETALAKLRDLIPKLESPRKMLSNGVFRFVRRQRVLRLHAAASHWGTTT